MESNINQYELSKNYNGCLCAFITKQDFTSADFNLRELNYNKTIRINNTFFSSLMYFSLFKTVADVSFNEWCNYVYSMIAQVAKSCEYTFKNEDYNKLIVYGLAINTYKFKDNSFEEVNEIDSDFLNTIINIEPDTEEEIWSMYILCNTILNNFLYCNSSNINYKYDISIYMGLSRKILSIRERFMDLNVITWNKDRKEIDLYETGNDISFN